MKSVSIIAGSLLFAVSAHGQLVVRNNHELPYRGPVDVRVSAPDGRYVGPNAHGHVRDGLAHLFVSLAPRASVELSASRAAPRAAQDFSVTAQGSSLALHRNARVVADVSLGLVVIAGTAATTDAAIATFAPMTLAWQRDADGVLRSRATHGEYDVQLTARPHGEGFLDVSAHVVRNGAGWTPAYVALVRRVVTPGARNAALRFNGREFATADSPELWDRDFWYVRGVDWLAWRSGGTSLLAVNRFTPVPTVRRDTLWREGSHFYVWEKTRQRGDTMYLVSEIAGPNAEQVKSRYMPVIPYAPLTAGDTVALAWRLAAANAPERTWAESQLRVYAGTRRAERQTIHLGVPFTRFGMAYFPYSTFTENFDYYRVPGLTSENFWPIAPAMWKQWRLFEPRMRTDLRIVRAMGFDEVRLHHLELLRAMPRAEAFAFLDFFAGETRALDMKWVVDSEGPAEWLTAVLGRYRDLVTRVELENEVLIGGITPDDPSRWSSLYAAAKAAVPDADVFFTGAGNNAMFDRLRTLGVPFDRVGLHLYKHGPQWKEAYASHVLGTAGYATSIGKPMTIGEFNWKDLTKLSPEVRRGEFAEIYERMLAPRAVPEIYQFQLQEQMAFNPSVGGSASRHYEPIGLDRRPKAEAFVTMDLIRKYGRPDAPVRVLPVMVDEVRMVNGRAIASFSVTNAGASRITVSLVTRAFDGTTTRLLSPATAALAPGATSRGRVEVMLPANARPGTYHHFIEAKSANTTSLGWGVIANQGAPTFADTSVLGARVQYAQGLGVVKALDWTRPLAVVFGDKAAVLELEQAFQLANTLQASTGRAVRISAERDLPDSLAMRGLVFVVGTATSSRLVAETRTAAPAGVGTISLHRANDSQWLVLTGADAKGVQAAVVELELRYWPNAKDAALRLVGMERGAALGNRTGGSNIDLP